MEIVAYAGLDAVKASSPQAKRHNMCGRGANEQGVSCPLTHKRLRYKHPPPRVEIEAIQFQAQGTRAVPCNHRGAGVPPTVENISLDDCVGFPSQSCAVRRGLNEGIDQNNRCSSGHAGKETRFCFGGRRVAHIYAICGHEFPYRRGKGTGAHNCHLDRRVRGDENAKSNEILH